MARKILKFISGIVLLGLIVITGFFGLHQFFEKRLLATINETYACQPFLTASPALPPNNTPADSSLLIEVSQIKKALLPKSLLTYQLMMAAGIGTVEDMKDVIAAGADVNSTHMFYPVSSPPLIAAIYGHKDSLEKIKILLANGADPNTINVRDGGSPLSVAASYHDVEIAQLLLAAGADVNRYTPRYGMMNAGGFGNKDFTMLNPLFMASSPDYSTRLPNRREKMIKLLIEAGAVFHPVSTTAQALSIAISSEGGPKVTAWLLGAGSRANELSHTGKNTLLMAVTIERNNPETVKTLLAAGADWAALSPEGETVFDLLDKNSTDPGRTEVIRKIILTEKLISLATKGSTEEVEEAIGQGVDVNRPNNFQTPLMGAATDLKSGADKAKLLLAAGANPSGRNGDRMTPLQVAAARNNIEVVKLLLKEGAEVNVVDNIGRTALWEASTRTQGDPKSRAEIIELLHGAGASSQPTPEALKVL